MPDVPYELRPDVRTGIARDGDMVEVLRRDPGVGETPGRGEIRKAGAMWDPVEALFFDGVHESPVDHDSRGGVTVIRVQTEDRRHGADRSRSLGADPWIAVRGRCPADIIATQRSPPPDRRIDAAGRLTVARRPQLLVLNEYYTAAAWAS